MRTQLCTGCGLEKELIINNFGRRFKDVFRTRCRVCEIKKRQEHKDLFNGDTQSLEGEVWKHVVGYDDLYKISSFGRVISCGRIQERFNKYGLKIKWEIKEKVIANALSTDGYCVLGIWKNGVMKRTSQHRLVAEAFIPNPYNKPVVNHINGIKTDNRVENLEWCTHAENLNHAFETGLRIPKSYDKNARFHLTEQDFLNIKELYKTNTVFNIAKNYKLKRIQVYQILLGEKITYR